MAQNNAGHMRLAENIIKARTKTRVHIWRNYLDQFWACFLESDELHLLVFDTTKHNLYIWMLIVDISVPPTND